MDYLSSAESELEKRGGGWRSFTPCECRRGGPRPRKNEEIWAPL